MSHHIAVYVDREKTLILSIYSKFSSHLKDNSWLLLLSNAIDLLLHPTELWTFQLHCPNPLFTKNKRPVFPFFEHFWFILLFFFNLLPTALNNCEVTTGKCSFDALLPKSDTSTYGSCKCHTDHYKELKKKRKSKPPQNSDNTYKMEQNKTQIVCVWFPFPFFKSL